MTKAVEERERARLKRRLPDLLVRKARVPQGRRQGLARLLLGNVLRCYHDQYFTLVETQVREHDAAALSLFRGLGFQQIDAGHLYRLSD